jgi:hypothetical protein
MFEEKYYFAPGESEGGAQPAGASGPIGPVGPVGGPAAVLEHGAAAAGDGSEQAGLHVLDPGAPELDLQHRLVEHGERLFLAHPVAAEGGFQVGGSPPQDRHQLPAPPVSRVARHRDRSYDELRPSLQGEPGVNR